MNVTQNTAIVAPAIGDVPFSAFFQTTAPVNGRHIPLTDAKSDAGVPLTATATGGAMGVARTAGTSLQLVGEATSSNAKTDKAMWEVTLPDTYVAGAAIPITVNASISGSGTLTGASTTLTLNAYTETNGVEAAISGVTAAQRIVAAGSNLLFSIPGTGLVSGARIVIELVMLITTASGANTGAINRLSIAA